MRKLEAGTSGGLLIAAIAIMGGLFLEGGHLVQVIQPTAALIVFGGTCGAVLTQFSFAGVQTALRSLLYAFQAPRLDSRARMEQIVRYAALARRNGIVSLDPELKKIDDPFFRKALMLAIDGIHGRELREVMELEMLRLEEDDEGSARVWEAAGGFSPTIGILGAVLGLIQVLQRLDDMGDVGRGIAVAFVATLYGVGLANLFLLPMAGKLRQRARAEQRLREVTLEGVLSMIEGTSPRMLREKLGAQGGDRVPAEVARLRVAR